MTQLLRFARFLVLAVCLGTPLAGCAAVMPLIPQIVSVVTDAMVVLGIIDNAVGEYFRSHPDLDPVVRARYVQAFQKAMTALNAAQHALRGAEDIDQQQYDAAFAEFKAAYQELLALLEKQGMLRQQYLSASPGTQVYVPTPEALTFRVGG